MAAVEVEDSLEIRTSDGIADSAIFAPARAGRWPGVILLTDIGGIREAHREMARQLAGADNGYTVLMPNLFYRTGRPPLFEFKLDFAEERTRARVAELRAPLTPEAIERDASTYVDTLLAHAHVFPGPLGVVGYCASGSIAIRMAAARPDAIVAAASFHGGGLYTDAPISPHLLLPHIKARVYFAHAVQDRSMPAEAIEGLERALAAWGGTYESETYEGAYHGWTIPDSSVYNQPQAERAFAKLTELFASTLKPQVSRQHA
jgi:carboxymethylenebutenolidase